MSPMASLLSTASGLTWTQLLADTGISLAALGVAYLALVTNAIIAAALFIVCRRKLVINPNKAGRDYGLFMAVLIAALLVAATLENEISHAATLPYVAFPHMLLLFAIHLWIYYRQEPWMIALGMSATAGLILMVAALGYGGNIRLAHWVIAGVATGFLIFLWISSVTTKRAFVKSSSTIYALSKEIDAETLIPQTPWLGLHQWVALVIASLTLATVNELLVGVGLAQIPAVEVLGQAGLVLAMTSLVSAIPAATYWLARKSWMPELTRFVWIVWLVVSFAFTYGNYLLRLQSV